MLSSSLIQTSSDNRLQNLIALLIPLIVSKSNRTIVWRRRNCSTRVSSPWRQVKPVVSKHITTYCSLSRSIAWFRKCHGFLGTVPERNVPCFSMFLVQLWWCHCRPLLQATIGRIMEPSIQDQNGPENKTRFVWCCTVSKVFKNGCFVCLLQPILRWPFLWYFASTLYTPTIVWYNLQYIII